MVHPVTDGRCILRSFTTPGLAIVLGPVIAFGCAQASDDPDATAASTQSGSAVFSVGDKELTLLTSGENCAVGHSGAAEPVILELTPPCHVMFWTSDPPDRAGDPSNGLSEGSKGDAMAWRYPDVGDDAVVAVLGDPVVAHIRESEEFADWLAKGWRCSGSLQALLVGDSGVRAGAKRKDIGAVCVEKGIDERGFWLLAHPPQ